MGKSSHCTRSPLAGNLAYEKNHGGASNPDVTFSLRGNVDCGICCRYRGGIGSRIRSAISCQTAFRADAGKTQDLGHGRHYKLQNRGRRHRQGAQKAASRTRTAVAEKTRRLHRDAVVTPWLKKVKEAGLAESREVFHDIAPYALTLSYRRDAHTLGGSYLSFTPAYSKSNNTVFNALKRKADQLRDSGFDGCKGIILCDAGCSLLRQRQVGAGAYSDKQVIDAFLKNHESISFVATLYVDVQQRWPSMGKIVRTLSGKLVRNPAAKFPLKDQLAEILCAIPALLPVPVNDGTNSIHRIEDGQYGEGHSSLGGYEMSGRHFKMSARVLLEVLSGKRTIAEFDAAYGFDQQQGSPNPFARALKAGHLLDGIALDSKSNEDDDSVTFQFGPAPDPAISPFVRRRRESP